MNRNFCTALMDLSPVIFENLDTDIRFPDLISSMGDHMLRDLRLGSA